MFEHPHLSQSIYEVEVQQRERALERRRLMLEHADQIVRRPEGAVVRLVRRVAGRLAGRRADAAPGRSAAAPCEAAVAR